MNSTFECGFSSLNDVLNQAATHGTNITEVVQGCPSICHLIWGVGNPDLSGIGANASYIIQFILIALFGPGFFLMSGRKTKKLQDAFVDISAQFTIPVAIAAVVRIKQGAPLYELTFLHALTSMQFLGLLAVMVASAVRDSPKADRQILLPLYSLVNFGFYMGVVGHLRTSKATWTQIHELGAACEGYGRIIPGFTYNNFPQINSTNLFDPNSPFAHSLLPVNITPKGQILVALIWAGIVGPFVAFAVIAALVWMFAEHFAPGLFLISLGLTSGSLYFLVEMQRARNFMKAVTGPEFQDNQWGFGQVISLFLWVPLLLALADYYDQRQQKAGRDQSK